MKLKAVLFDLDGTLLPMDNKAFAESYFSAFAKTMKRYGWSEDQAVESILRAIKTTQANDGLQTNEQVYLSAFLGREEALDQGKGYFDDFYGHEFEQVRFTCGYNVKAKQTVDVIKSLGYRVALATSPLFPKIAIEKRMEWAGFTPKDFEFYTTYEDHRFCKPDPRYYGEVAARLGLKAEECLMVGNDVVDDMSAEKARMKVFLLTDCIKNDIGADISAYPKGDLDGLLEYVKILN